MRQVLEVIFSIDTEEEGLFSGEYHRTPLGVRNVVELRRLEFVVREFGIPLTLLVSYHVTKDPACCEVLLRWQEELSAEIGAHLHPWNTPPFSDFVSQKPMPSDCMPEPLLRAKLETLLEAIKDNLGIQPRSFRMGRWDFGWQIRQLLPQYSIVVDSSLVPCRHAVGGPENFLVPYDPFWLEVGGATEGGGTRMRVYEVPLTVVPILAALPGWFHDLAQRLPRKHREWLLAGFRAWGAVGPQPLWYPQASMRLAVRLHTRRRGQVLSLFLHSSELMPGASPNVPDEAAALRLTEKIRSFLAWLVRTYTVKGMLLAGMLPD